MCRAESFSFCDVNTRESWSIVRCVLCCHICRFCVPVLILFKNDVYVFVCICKHMCAHEHMRVCVRLCVFVCL